MDSARKRAEEALVEYDRGSVHAGRLTDALRALLASEPAKVSGSVSIVRSDDPPAKPLPTCVNCGSNFIEPAPPASEAVREAAERAVNRLDNLIGALSLPLTDAMHVNALRLALPSVSQELAEAIAYDQEDGE